MADINSLIAGFRTFKATEYERFKDLIAHVIQLDIKPTTLVIACSDMRIAPGKILSANPGDLYVVRNMGAFVPTYNEDGANGTIAAIEFAVQVLHIENIIVMGHTNCRSIKALLNDDKSAIDSEPVRRWLALASEAKDAVLEQLHDKTDTEKAEACAQESILVSLKNLLNYPVVGDYAKIGKVKLYGWQFDIVKGQLLAFNPQTRFFEAVE